MDRTLEVIVGLGGTYLFLAIVVSALVETAAGLLGLRARKLERSLRALLSPDLYNKVLQHPLINALSVASRTRLSFARDRPSYIPTAHFVEAFIDTAKVYGDTKTLPPSAKSLIDDIKADAASARSRAEAWFDACMDRVSGGYRRNAQWISRGFSVALVVGLNVNTIAMAEQLWGDQVAKDLAVTRAKALLAKCPNSDTPNEPPTPLPPSTPVVAATSSASQPATREGVPSSECETAVLANADTDLPLPLGWTSVARAEFSRNIGTIFWGLLGMFLSVVLVGLGAPFWFDLLRRIAPGIQQTGPKPKTATS